jgi:hypothetical protein
MASKKRLEPGTRMQLTRRTIFGWKGIGIVVSDRGGDDDMHVIKEDSGERVEACRYQWRVLRDQSAKEQKPMSDDEREPDFEIDDADDDFWDDDDDWDWDPERAWARFVAEEIVGLRRIEAEAEPEGGER